MTEFEKWLLDRIDWMAGQLYTAVDQDNKVFRIIYQSGLDVLREVHRVWRQKAEDEGGCSGCPYKEKLDMVRKMLGEGKP